MDMGTSTMAMDMSSTAAATSTAATASNTMSMSMGGSDCRISMLWNWYTVDSCFISQSWHITSKGMFAGSCIGVILLVMSLELLKRASREYDRAILLKAQQTHRAVAVTASPSKSPSSEDSLRAPPVTPAKFRPNIFQQVIRATFHMVQFAVAYFIMLLAMYYNGYIIICIIIGAWLGAFVFSWEAIGLG
ncbi:related to copper transport protein [Phialocephala subalpina]|uniref:Copper transport protein n=1 Tax=Phialocephala subalpina TaxID=576137 RepID=A0A1L7XBT6_9HELO|nr:related to copper transport protein [Phialocephala subalpina]